MERAPPREAADATVSVRCTYPGPNVGRRSLLTDFKQRTPTERLYSERLDVLAPLLLRDAVVELLVPLSASFVQYRCAGLAGSEHHGPGALAQDVIVVSSACIH